MTETLKERIEKTEKEIEDIEQKLLYLKEDIRFQRQMLKIKLRHLATYNTLAGGKNVEHN
jgi:peptidoglycan hydrolase CwlO-like protein